MSDFLDSELYDKPRPEFTGITAHHDLPTGDRRPTYWDGGPALRAEVLRRMLREAALESGVMYYVIATSYKELGLQLGIVSAESAGAAMQHCIDEYRKAHGLKTNIQLRCRKLYENADPALATEYYNLIDRGIKQLQEEASETGASEQLRSVGGDADPSA